MQPQIQFWPWADCWRQGKPLRLPHAAQTAWVPQRWLFQNEGVLPQDTRCWHNPRQAIAPRNLNGDWPSQAGQSPDAPALRKRGREGKACPHYVGNAEDPAGGSPIRLRDRLSSFEQSRATNRRLRVRVPGGEPLGGEKLRALPGLAGIHQCPGRVERP